MDKQKLGIVLAFVGTIFIITGFYLKPVQVEANTKKIAITPVERPLEENHAAFKATVAHKFNKKYFSELTVENAFDLNMKFANRGETHPFSIVCAYYKKLPSGGISFKNNKRFSLCKEHQAQTKQPAFIVVGTEGTVTQPKRIFALPLEVVSANIIPVGILEKYEKKNASGRFFYDYKKGELR